MATLGFFESWNGPPLWAPQYRWAQLLVAAVAALCFALLCILALRRRLLPLRYIVLSLLPLFTGLLLSVSLSISILWPYYTSFVFAGGAPEDLVVFALLCSVIAAPFSVVLLIVFGIVLVVCRPNPYEGCQRASLVRRIFGYMGLVG